jgi:hypothetical protein
MRRHQKLLIRNYCERGSLEELRVQHLIDPPSFDGNLE